MFEIKLALSSVPSLMPAYSALSSSDSAEDSISNFLACLCADKENAVYKIVEMAVSLEKNLETAMPTEGTTAPERPHSGQTHTFTGDRGRQEINGISVRDVADCMVKGLAWSANDQLTDEARARIDADQFTYEELYDLNLSLIDPIAAVQNLIVEIEKRMNIFPNVPGLIAEYK